MVQRIEFLGLIEGDDGDFALRLKGNGIFRSGHHGDCERESPEERGIEEIRLEGIVGDAAHRRKRESGALLTTATNGVDDAEASRVLRNIFRALKIFNGPPWAKFTDTFRAACFRFAIAVYSFEIEQPYLLAMLRKPYGSSLPRLALPAGTVDGPKLSMTKARRTMQRVGSARLSHRS